MKVNSFIFLCRIESFQAVTATVRGHFFFLVSCWENKIANMMYIRRPALSAALADLVARGRSIEAALVKITMGFCLAEAKCFEIQESPIALADCLAGAPALGRGRNRASTDPETAGDMLRSHSRSDANPMTRSSDSANSASL
jgi:hypothetical protein